jgi:hypothetical protein
VIEEPAPLVEVDHEHGASPIGALNDGLVDLVEEGLAIANVGAGMIVVRGATVFIYESWIDE